MYFQKHLKSFFPIALLGMLSILAPCSFNQYSPGGSIKITAKFPGKDVNPKNYKLAKPLTADDTYVPPFVDRIHLILSKEGETKYEATKEKDDDGIISNLFDNLPELEYGTYQIAINCYICSSGGTKLHYRDCQESNWKLTHLVATTSLEISPTNLSGEVVANLRTNSGIILDNTPVSIENNFGISIDFIDVDSNGNFLICKPNVSSGIDANWLDLRAFNSHSESIIGANPTETPHRAFNSFSMSDYCKISGNNIFAAYAYTPSDLSTNKLLLTKVTYDQNGLVYKEELDTGIVLENPNNTNPSIDANNSFVTVAWADGISGVKIYFRTYSRDLVPISAVKEISCPGENCFSPYAKMIGDDKFALLFITFDGTIYKVGGQTFDNNGIPLTESAKILSSNSITTNTFSFDFLKNDRLILFYQNDIFGSAGGILDSSLSWQTGPITGIDFIADAPLASQFSPDGMAYSYMDDQILAVWKDDGENKIVYGFIDDNISGGPLHTAKELGAETVNQFYVALNEDGFGILAWVPSAGILRFQRIIF
jgi:hypothetical protein